MTALISPVGAAVITNSIISQLYMAFSEHCALAKSVVYEEKNVRP